MRAFLILMALVLSAQSPDPQKSEPGRKITDAQRARFWRAQAEYASAMAQVQAARSALDAARDELMKYCGDRPLILSGNGEPDCGSKPPTPGEKPKPQSER